MPYNPFPKPIPSTLTPDDLELLITNEVAEGYFVEYKKTLPPEKDKIAKSIASLANTYGGWYFVGVQEENGIAEAICGYDVSESPKATDRIRDIVKSRTDPTPVFYSQTVRLSETREVLVVYVPGNQQAPFITTDGRVYRRVADSSDPVYEHDRFVLDQIVERGKDPSRRFEAFCDDQRTFSRAEEEGAWLQLYFSPNPLERLAALAPQHLGSDRLAALIDLSQTPLSIPLPNLPEETITGSIPFDTAQLAGQSVILRQVAGKSRALNSLEIELFFDGRAKFLVPLPGIAFGDDDYSQARNQTAKSALRSSLGRDAERELLRFVDMYRLWATIAVLTSFYFQYSADLRQVPDLRWAAKLRGVWRTVPFADSQAWGEHVKRCGLPVNMRDDASTPDPIEGGHLLQQEEHRALWFGIVGRVSLAMGLPPDVAADGVSRSFDFLAKSL
jgi:hypothetical protein